MLLPMLATASIALSCATLRTSTLPIRTAVPTLRVTMGTPDNPVSSVGVDGGDVWSGQRVSREALLEAVDEAMSMTIQLPIIAQYYPGRKWLWVQWGGTIIRRVLPREVLANLIFALVVSLLFRGPGPQAAVRARMAESYLAGIAKTWTLSATMASFMFSFFLSQSYSLWRSVYSLTRRLQGRLNDLGLLCATFAERDASTGRSMCIYVHVHIRACSYVEVHVHGSACLLIHLCSVLLLAHLLTRLVTRRRQRRCSATSPATFDSSTCSSTRLSRLALPHSALPGYEHMPTCPHEHTSTCPHAHMHTSTLQ